MSDEYMPSTDEIRELVRAASAFETLSGIPASEVLAAFDRWLAARDEQVRAAERERCAQIAGKQAEAAWADDYTWDDGTWMSPDERQAADDSAQRILRAIEAVPAEQKESE